MFEDERKSAGALISADPAFTALEASGAPIIAMMGEPLRVSYANASARAVFGDDPGLRLLSGNDPGAHRLADMIESVRHGAAPRLERMPIAFGSTVRTITILCRRLTDVEGEPCFVIAALGLRADIPAARVALLPSATSQTTPCGPAAPSLIEETISVNEKLAAIESTDVKTGPGADALRVRLGERQEDHARRFLWKTDAAGRFVDVTHVLEDVVGEKNADLLGRSVDEVSRSLGLGPAFAAALATHKSWSGVEIDWPVEKPDAVAPTTLGALPIHDAQRRFLGFQGYGVLRPAKAKPQAPITASASEFDAPPQEQPKSPVVSAVAETAVDDGYAGANVVTLRPMCAAQRESADAAEALSPQEQSAFDEIARTLGYPTPTPAWPPPPGSARDLIDHVGRVLETSRAPASLETPKPDREAGLIDLLPVGVLVARGSHTLFANRTLLDYLGYADLEALMADGGLARVFLGRWPQSLATRAPTEAVEVQAQDGETLAADAHLQTIDWDGAPATLISLRRRVSTGGDEVAARALARSQGVELTRMRLESGALSACFERNPAPAAIIAENGRIERVNQAFAKMLGLEPHACVGLELARFVDEGDGSRVKAFFSPPAILVAERSLADGAEIKFRGLGKGAATQLLSLQRLGDGASRAVCFGSGETMPVAAKPEADAAREEAERANAAKSAFLARVSHEIRTPLNAIIGFAEVMMEERFGPIGSERYKEYLKDVHTSGVHVLSLVNDLLDLSKIEAGKMELMVEQIDVNSIIGECVSIMQTQANQHRVIVRLSLAPRLPRIRADERSLRQILLNLLSNAVKFNEPGGQVIVSTALTDAGYVLIRVKDTGIGMSDDEIAIALEPFRQVDTSRRTTGTGLGLPVTKALVEANHASFLIKSRKHEGTLIEVAFPSVQGLAAE